MPDRPVGTQLFIDEDYVSKLEDRIQEKEQLVERWKKYLGHTIDLLEILRDQYDDFDKVISNFNDMDTGIEILVNQDNEIKFRVTNAESKEN